MSSVLQQFGDFETFLRSALKRGISLTVPQVKSILGSIGLPPLKSGSDQRGNVVKRDLVQYMFRMCFQMKARRRSLECLMRSPQKYKEKENKNRS